MSHGRNTLSPQTSTPEEIATVTPETASPDGLSELLRRHRAGDKLVSAVVEDISPDGVPLVVVSGDTQSREASTVLRFASRAAASAAILGRTVLVLDTPSGRPVIIGVVSDRLWDEDTPQTAEAEVHLPSTTPRSVQVDKRKLELEASDEIRLTCGKSSLLLRRDGTIIVKGVTITSRASQTNKIRGATVHIN